MDATTRTVIVVTIALLIGLGVIIAMIVTKHKQEKEKFLGSSGYITISSLRNYNHPVWIPRRNGKGGFWTIPHRTIL